MSINVCLAGNPNSGKTTLFNTLTGANQHVGNWPGVTVEKKEGKVRNHKEITIVDLPGIYSLSPYSLEEVISRNYIINNHPDVIVNIVDATNLERNLYLTTQLIDTGIPVVIALNMMDVVRNNEDTIATDKLEKLMNAPCVEIVAIKEKGIDDLIRTIADIVKEDKDFQPVIWFQPEIESWISRISDLIFSHYETNLVRWYAIKYLEQDEEAMKTLDLPEPIVAKLMEMIRESEASGIDYEAAITKNRYAFVAKVYQKAFQKNKIARQRLSDKIDKVMTNKWLALPIFFAVIFLVYYLSISSIGGIMSGFVNEVIFGENGIPAIVNGWLEALNTWPWLQGLIVNGIIGGVGAVLGFLPMMLVLFILLGILEESGYMARIAFILDRLFRRFGLSGKSFIPMLISTGCAIPGVMAARTIEDEKNRKMTIMTATFMPCGAKLPIIALIAGAMFAGSGIRWIVAPSAYFIGIGTVIISGIILKKFKAFAGDPAPFIMELPDYHLPQLKSLSFHVWNKLKSFIKKAGTVILAASIVVWFLSSFNFAFRMVEDVDESILSGIGRTIDIIFRPLGWEDWKATVATFTGLVAKENVVTTFGILYGFAEVSEDGAEYWELLANDFTVLSAYSFLVFNLICAPCFAAIGAIRREMGSAKWTLIAIGFQTGMAYLLGLIVYQVGSIFTGVFSVGSVIGILALAGLIYLLFRKNPYLRKYPEVEVTNL